MWLGALWVGNRVASTLAIACFWNAPEKKTENRSPSNGGQFMLPNLPSAGRPPIGHSTMERTSRVSLEQSNG